MAYCVYKHTSPSGKAYIGVTSIAPEKRWGYGKGYFGNEYFTRAINKYGWDNFDHEILHTDLTMEEAWEKERELIALYHSNDPRFGYNLTTGGEIGKKHSEFTKEKMRNAKIGKYVGDRNPMYGKCLSEETKRKISESLKGRLSGENNPNFGKAMSEEQKVLISKSRKGRHFPKLSESVKNSPACIAVREKMKKQIAQCSHDGKIIKIWNGAADASSVLLGHPRGQSNICSCANGNLKTAYGYIWKYINDIADIIQQI